MKLFGFAALVASAATALVLGVGSAGASSHDLINVKYTTSFGTFGRESYVYVALDRGYFAQAGLNVSITPGLGTVSDAQLIAAGQTDFSPGDLTGLALAVANSGLPVKCVVPIHQTMMGGYIARASSGIKTFKDFAGRTVANPPGGTDAVLLPKILKKVGVDPNSVSTVPATPQTAVSTFAASKVDLVEQFAVGVPTVQAAIGGEPVNFIADTSVFPGLIGNCLMVSDKMLGSDPTLVRRFTWALMQGLKWALDNPDAAGQILHKYVPLQDPNLAAAELKVMKKYVVTPETVKYGYGYVNPKRVASSVSIVNSFFNPKTPLKASDIWAFGFQPKPVIKASGSATTKPAAKPKPKPKKTRK